MSTAQVMLSIFIALLTPAPMIVMKHAIDAYMVPGHYGGLFMMAGVLLLLNLILSAVDQYSQYLIARIGQYVRRWP